MTTAMLPPANPIMKKEKEYEQDLTNKLICPECLENPPNIIEEFSNGDTVCASCGLIIGSRIVDTRSEWRTFSNDDQGSDDPSRVGDTANPLLNGPQLETMISYSDGGSGRSRELHRAQNKSNNDKSSKALMAAYKEIGAFCDSTNLPKNVSDTAKYFFKMIEDNKAFKGKPQEAIIAGCIFLACRQCNVPRTFKEIYALTKVPKKEIGRIFKQLEKFVHEQDDKRKQRDMDNGIYVDMEDQTLKVSKSTNASDLMIRFCNSLGLSQSTTTVCENLAKEASTKGTLAGRSPISTAAACIFLVSHLRKEPKTAKEISLVAGVSDGTIRNAYKQLLKEKEKLIKPGWVENGKGSMDLLPQAQKDVGQKKDSSLFGDVYGDTLKLSMTNLDGTKDQKYVLENETVSALQKLGYMTTRTAEDFGCLSSKLTSTPRKIVNHGTFQHRLIGNTPETISLDSIGTGTGQYALTFEELMSNR